MNLIKNTLKSYIYSPSSNAFLAARMAIYLERCKDRIDLSQTGVYFLFESSDDTGENVVYIGQAGVRKNGESILYRLQEHKRNPDKDYWTEAAVFTTSKLNIAFSSISSRYMRAKLHIFNTNTFFCFICK
jgi:hypothetical protein